MTHYLYRLSNLNILFEFCCDSKIKLQINFVIQKIICNIKVALRDMKFNIIINRYWNGVKYKFAI